MKFVEMNGATLLKLAGEEELAGLEAAGVTADSQVRVNPQGDIEIWQRGEWSIIGGLIGDYANRIRQLTGRDWS
jgi:hypothetical protein